MSIQAALRMAGVSVLAVMGSQAQAGPLADATKDHLWGIELGGYLELSSTYNFNDPADDANALRIFDTDDSDVIDFNALQLYIDRLPDELGEAGFRVDVLIGEDADIIGGGDDVLASDETNIYQAYISYIVPVGNGLTIDAGRFATWHGYEVIEAGANDNFSRSFLFGLAIPFTHTGFRFSYDFNDIVGVSAGITQGWDTVEDNNDALTFHGAVGLTLLDERLSINNSIAYGPEKDDPGNNPLTGLPFPGQGQNSDNRFLYDLVASYQVTDQFLVGANFDYATEENDGGVFDETTGTTLLGVDDFTWYGFAGYLRYDFREDMYVALRGEFFDDEDGARTGTPNELWEVTLTYGYQITDQLLGRLEYRHDNADEDVFLDDDGFDDSQDTFAFEVVYSF